MKYVIFQSKKMADNRKILSEADVIERLQNADFAFPPLRFDLLETQFDQPDKIQWDLMIAVSWGNRKFRFAVECKALFTPKAFQDAIRRLKEASPPAACLPLLVLPFLRESQLRELERQGISGIDLCGNGFVSAPGRFAVFRTGADNRFPTYAPIKNVYRKNTSMVARLLLAVPFFERVQDVRDAVAARDILAMFWAKTPIRLGTVSKALKGLEDDLIVGREQGIRLLQPEKLIDKLQQNYETPRTLGRTRIKIEGSRQTVIQVVRDAADQADLPIMATGLSSVSRYALMQREEILSVYCPRSARLLDRLPARADDRFPNLEIIQAEEQTLYFNSRWEDGFLWASPVQTYLELMAGDKRDRETAEQVRATLLDRLKGKGQ